MFMWDNQWIQVLTVFALLFFNLLCLIGIIAGISTLVVLGTVNKKIKEVSEYSKETLHKVQEAAENMTEAGVNVASFLSPFIFRKKGKGLFGLFKSFWK